MEKIIVKDLINRNNATSQGNAILLRDNIIKILSEKRREVIVDFSDINNYTILFSFALNFLKIFISLKRKRTNFFVLLFNTIYL